MLRTDCVANQGLEEASNTEAPRNAPGPSAPPAESSPEPSNSSSSASTSSGENHSKDTNIDLDPHICKFFPCPVCHPPRETQDGNPTVAVDSAPRCEGGTSTNPSQSCDSRR